LIVDIVTHTLASAALVRAFFPRAGRMTWAAAIVSGTIADIDLLSIWIGPAAFLTVHGTYTHSILGMLALATLVCGVLWLLWRQTSELTAAVVAAFSAAALHLAMDASQSAGVSLWWPMNGHRVALDWLASLDPWILLALIAGIALPELLRLVGGEIGVKEKTPRGRNGAIAALAIIVFYAGVRAMMHSTAVSQMLQHTYKGELPRRVAAFPDPVTLFTWRGIVETESNLLHAEVSVGPSGVFNPEAGTTIHKPEPSAALDAALATKAARKFLSVARYPKASVESSELGADIVLKDLAIEAAGESRHETAVNVRLDAAGKIVGQEMVWARDLSLR
jgi:membrane-bound metal-dependent hydrolase YbcI (DUF457 family)